MFLQAVRKMTKVHRLSRLALLVRDASSINEHFEEVYFDIDSLNYEHIQALAQYPLSIDTLCIRTDTPVVSLKVLPQSLRVALKSIQVDPPQIPKSDVLIKDLCVLFPQVSSVTLKTHVNDIAQLLGTSEAHTPLHLTVHIDNTTTAIEIVDLPDIEKITLHGETVSPFTLTLRDLPQLREFNDHSKAIPESAMLETLPKLDVALEITAQKSARISGLSSLASAIVDASAHVAVRDCPQLTRLSIAMDCGEEEDTAVVLERLPSLKEVHARGMKNVRYVTAHELPQLERFAIDKDNCAVSKAFVSHPNVDVINAY